MIWKISFLLISMTIFSYSFAPKKVDVEPPKKKSKITNFVFNLFRFRRSSPSTTTTTTQQEEDLINKDKTSLEYFITRASRISSVRQNATIAEVIELLEKIYQHKNSRRIFSQLQTPGSSHPGNYFDYIFLSLSTSIKNPSEIYTKLRVTFIICKILNMNKHLDILSKFFIIDQCGSLRLNFEQIFAEPRVDHLLNALNDALLLINEKNIESNIMRCCDTVKTISKLAGKLYDLTKSGDGESFIANRISRLNLNATNLLDATTDLIEICCYIEKTILNINLNPWDKYFFSDRTINVNKVLEDLDKIPTEAEDLINRLKS